MRLFVALWPPAAALAELQSAVEPVRAEHSDLRWQPTARWHLTMAFIGAVDDAREPAVREAVARAAAAEPVSQAVRLAGAGTFGRLLWIGLEPHPSPVAPLAQAVACELRASGFAIERRPWSPHLTVARARDGLADLQAGRAALASYIGPEWFVTELTLVRSQTGPQPSYEVLARLPVASTA